MVKLTARAVAALQAPGRYSDGGGLHLWVTAAGRRYWILRVTVAGKRRDISLGGYPLISLRAAREKALAVRREMAAGAYQPRSHDARPRSVTFRAAAEAVIASRRPAWRNARHGKQWPRSLELYVYPLLGERDVADVSRADVIEVLAPHWLRIPDLARRVMQRIDVVLRWAAGMGYRAGRIDMQLVRQALPPQPRRRGRHYPAVPWPDVPAFYAGIAFSNSAPQMRVALRWQILTAARPGNTARARWADIDVENGVWDIPAAEMKSGVAHRVPLVQSALDLLSGLRPVSNGAYVFALPQVDRPLSPDTLRMQMRRLGSSAAPHGFRSSFKDWSLSAGWPDYLSEVALAHVDKDAVRAAYARSDLLEERRPLMQAWADYVTGVSGQALPRSAEMPRKP